MHLERASTGYRVRYAIADLAEFVLPDGQLDLSLRKRALTIYCPDLRVPLHPTVLSEGAASLLPGQVRPAVVWDFRLDEVGEVQHVTVLRALVRSRAQLDYPAEQARLDAGAAGEVMRLLVEVGRARSRIERARGGVSLGRPEQEVVHDPGGGFALAFRAAIPLEEHNAQISLMTGMAAASMMLEAGVGVLRTMPAAAPEDLSGLRGRALALGVPWGDGVSYQDMLAGLDRTRPAVAAFLTAAVGLFRGAAWRPFRGEPPADVVHGAVGAPYAHVTAPLRRLVDRYGTEICLAAQRRPGGPGVGPGRTRLDRDGHGRRCAPCVVGRPCVHGPCRGCGARITRRGGVRRDRVGRADGAAAGPGGRRADRGRWPAGRASGAGPGVDSGSAST